MYIIGSYLILLALVLVFAAALFAGTVVVIALKEIGRLLRGVVGAGFAASARLVTRWIPKPASAFWPHHRTQHSH